MIQIDIRPLEKNELHRLQFFPFSKMETHRRRFELQEAGKLVFLMAWWDDVPVGQVLLNWVGGDASGVPPQIRELPEVSSLFVSKSYRRMGIATQLLDVAERMTFSHGYDEMGLCVAETNLGAQRLYTQRGYADAGWLPYLARGMYTDSSGNQCRWEEIRVYWVKSLTSQSVMHDSEDEKRDAAG